MAERKKKTTTTRVKSAPVTATKYEAMFLFPPPGTTDVEAMTNMAKGIIERHGGKILHVKRWDERKLAYEIKRQKRGTYIVAFYQGPGASVGAIERDVNLSEDILRVLVTDASHLNEKEMNAVEPQPIQPREERAPWDKPDFNRPMRRDDRGPRSDDRDRGGDRPPRREDSAPAEASAGAGQE
jgi:small subunit ribosomal protein S6